MFLRVCSVFQDKRTYGFNSLKKQVLSPVWQTLPSPSLVTLSKMVSLSQSVSISWTCSLFPDVSPFIQRVCLVRLKNVAKPVTFVCSKACSFMKPTMRTSLLTLSCTMAGISPSSFEKSMFYSLHHKKRPRRRRGRGCACLGSVTQSFRARRTPIDLPAKGMMMVTM